MTIHFARLEDAPGIMQVHREAILSRASGHYPAAILAAWGPGVTDQRVARMRQQISDPEFLILVAEADQEVIGFAMAVPSKGELRAVYVKRNPIGGVGRALLGELERRAFQTAESLICDASLNAVEFYRSNGYRELGAADHVLSSGVSVPCIRMKKDRR